MKRTLSLLLIICLFLPCLASCNGQLSIGIKMSDFNPWLKNTDASQVVKVEEIHRYFGIAPEQEMTSYYSTDADVIAEYMEWCNRMRLVPELGFSGLVAGGGSTTMVFTFADGSTKEIYTKHGVYTKDNISYRVRVSSDFDLSNMNRFCRFNVSEEGYSIYGCTDEPTLVKKAENGASELGFVKYENEQNPEIEPTHYLEASFGTVYFYSETLCYIDTKYGKDGYFELYGTTLSGLINN